MNDAVEDGIVEYWVYPDGWDSLSLSQTLSLKAQCEDFVSKLVPPSFLWNGAPFALELTEGLPGVLHGRQFFGSDMQDEWFVVHLLFSLTRAHTDLTVRITDSDGEFLLIESSEHLPEWLTPETSHNRVFVRGGALCILSIPQSPAELGVLPLECPATPEAGLSALLRAPTASIAAPTPMQECIAAKLAEFPRVLEERRQRARAVLPRGAAHVLRRFPRLAPHAANAFRGQDPDEKIERVSDNGGALGSGGDVEVVVALTRFTYAELMYTEQHGAEEEEDLFARALGRMLAAGLECIVRRGRTFTKGRAVDSERRMIVADCEDIERALDEVRRGDVPDFGRVNVAEVDSDEWMDVDPDEFDEVLRNKTKRDLVDDVNKFMMGSSEFDGVRGGDNGDFNIDDDDDDFNSDNDDDDDYDENDETLNFDPDKMFSLIKNALMSGSTDDHSENGDYANDIDDERKFQEELERELKKSTLGEMYNDGNNDEESDEIAAQCLLKSLSEPGNPLSSLLYMNSSHTHK